MIIILVQLLQQRHASPPGAQNNQLGLVLEFLILSAIVVVDKVVGDGEVLGSAAAGVEGEFGDGNVGCDGVVVVCVGVVDEEGDDEAAADCDKGAEDGGSAVGEPGSS